MKFNTADRTYKQLNDFIRGEMKRKKIKQEDVAYRLNLQQATISQKLNGKVEWKLQNVFYDMNEKPYDFLLVSHSNVMPEKWKK